MKPSQVIALFVKPPIPGQVKTRLAKDIGADAACAIYRKLAEETLQQATLSGIPLVLFHDGNNPLALPVAWRGSASNCLPQHGEDLGQRMVHAFQALFAGGADQVALIGSDIPGMDTCYLTAAFEKLQQHDVVIGPAIDGGYCLIGFHRKTFTPTLFQQIPWSTDQVLKLTLSAAEAARLSVGMLPPLRDIDTIDDLHILGFVLT